MSSTFFINIFITSIYVQIFTYFWNEDFIWRATENLINSTFRGFYEEREEYIKKFNDAVFCALFHNLLCKISSF